MKQLLLLIPILFISCPSNITLSEEEALSLLKERYEGKGCYNTTENNVADYLGANYKPFVRTLKELQTEGLLWMGTEPQYIHGKKVGNTYAWSPTKKAKEKYLHSSGNKYQMTEIIVDEILGIAINQESNTALVNFSVEKRATPFRKLINSRYTNNCKPSSEERELEFVLYDTGWKIKKKKY